MKAKVVKAAVMRAGVHCEEVSYTQVCVERLKFSTDPRKTKMITAKMLRKIAKYLYSVRRKELAPVYRHIHS